MPLSDKDKEKVKKLVGQYLDAQDKAKAERRSAVGEINAAEKTKLNGILLQAGKLDISKDAFKSAITMERHIRNARGVPEKVAADDDVENAGNFASVILATGSAFEPVLDQKDREAQEAAVSKGEQAAASGGDQGNGGDDKNELPKTGAAVETLAERRKRKTEEEQAAAPPLH